MAFLVNPPPQLRIPRVVLKDPEWLEYEKQRDVILFQLWQKLGGNEDPISDITSQNVTSFNSILQQTIKRLDGLSEFTIDPSGFTTDLTFITTDKVIA